MKYQFYGNKLHLVKYVVKRVEKNIFVDPNGKEITTTHELSENVETQEDKEHFLEMFPNSTVVEVDNTGYEWLEGMEFTKEQQAAGEVEKAIEIGEAAYSEYLLANDRNAQILDLDYRLSLIELGVGGENL